MAKEKGRPEKEQPTPHILRQTAAMQAMVDEPGNRHPVILADIATLLLRDHNNKRLVKLLDPRHPIAAVDLEEHRLKKLTPLAEKQWGHGLAVKARLDDPATISLYFLMDSRPFAPEHRENMEFMESQRKGASTHYRQIFRQLCDTLEDSLPAMASEGIIPDKGGYRARFYTSADDPMATAAYITVPRQSQKALAHLESFLSNVEYPVMVDPQGTPLTSRSGSLIR